MSEPPAELVDGIRTRITPLFPGWDAERIECLVQQIASVEWRYLAGSDAERLGAWALDRTPRPSRTPPRDNRDAT